MAANKVEFRSENFTVEKTQSNDKKNAEIKITGIALPYDTQSRNGVKYTEESIKAAAETLEGKPFLFNHDPNQVLGSVDEVNPTDTHLEFTARADATKEKVKDIQNGYVSTVSIQAMVDEAENEDEEGAYDVREFLELSSAPIPGYNEAKAQAQNVRIEEFDITAREKPKNKENQEKDKSEKDKENDDGKRVGEPFAGYRDMDECISDNSDKDDPGGFCAYLHHKATGKWPAEEVMKKIGDFKMADDKGKDKEKRKDEQIEDIADALQWLEDNAPDEVTEIINDAIQSDQENGDGEGDDGEETETNDGDDGEQEKTEEKLEKLESKVEKLKNLIDNEDVEKSKQESIPTDSKPETADLVESIKELNEK